MSENVKALTRQANPLNKQIAWWIVVVEGGVAALLGLFLIFQPEQANSRFIQIIGGYLTFMSALALYRTVAHKEETATGALGWVHVGIGLVAGLIALFHPRLPTIDTAGATTVLAVGMLLLGIIGLYGFFTTPNQAERRWSGLIINFLYLSFAYLVFAHNRGNLQTNGNVVWWMGLLITAGGIALVVYGVRLRSAAQAAIAASAPGTPAPLPAAAVPGGSLNPTSPNPTAANPTQTTTPAAPKNAQSKVPTNGQH